jgi:hypothetical protein
MKTSIHQKSRVTILIVLLFSSIAGLTQELNRKVNDEKAEEEILIGPCNKDGLLEGEFGIYFDEYYSGYEPDKQIIKALRTKKEGVSVTIVLGTWCHDSKEQVPRFYKILNKLKWKDDYLEQYCVNTSKVADSMDVSKYDIVRVPTFIFYRDGQEIGRIIETPVKTLESDMLMILD